MSCTGSESEIPVLSTNFLMIPSLSQVISFKIAFLLLKISLKLVIIFCFESLVHDALGSHIPAIVNSHISISTGINKNFGLSFSKISSIKKIIEKSKYDKINFFVLDKVFLDNKKIQDLKVKKFFYTIKKKTEFKKYSKNNSLIFENF